MYCTLDDILAIVPENDLIELTDDSMPALAIDQAVIDRAIGDAGELVDGYLRGRYALPLSPVPGLINTLAADIAVYRLYARRSRLTPPEGVSERYKEAQKLMERIQAGKISIGTEITGGTQTPVAGGPQVNAPGRVFSRDTLEDYLS